jgi:hypothetical protein
LTGCRSPDERLVGRCDRPVKLISQTASGSRDLAESRSGSGEVPRLIFSGEKGLVMVAPISEKPTGLNPDSAWSDGAGAKSALDD